MVGNVVLCVGVISLLSSIYILSRIINKLLDREQILLDRIMAKNYTEYIQGEVARDIKTPPLTPEEIYEMQERGIPV